MASVSLLEQNFGTKLKFFFPGRRAEKKNTPLEKIHQPLDNATWEATKLL